MEKILLQIYHFYQKRRLALFITFAVIFLTAVWFALQVKFEEDISKILPKDKKIEKLNEVFQNSKFMDKLAVTVSLKDTAAAAEPDSLVAYADTLVENIQQRLAPFITKINYKVDDGLALELFETVSDHLPVYLNEKDYAEIDSLITPARVRRSLEENFRTLTSPSGFALKTMISKDLLPSLPK